MLCASADAFVSQLRAESVMHMHAASGVSWVQRLTLGPLLLFCNCRQGTMSLPAKPQAQTGNTMFDSPHRVPNRCPCQPSCSGRQKAASSRCRAAPASTEIATAPVSGKSFIRPHLLNMEPYTPILPFEILSQQMGMDPQDIVKLDANENPYGPPPEVREALGKIEFPNIYPDPETRRLRTALSELNDIPLQHLLVSLETFKLAQTCIC